jgi:hypothetical protein
MDERKQGNFHVVEVVGKINSNFFDLTSNIVGNIQILKAWQLIMWK